MHVGAELSRRLEREREDFVVLRHPAHSTVCSLGSRQYRPAASQYRIWGRSTPSIQNGTACHLPLTATCIDWTAFCRKHYTGTARRGEPFPGPLAACAGCFASFQIGPAEEIVRGDIRSQFFWPAHHAITKRLKPTATTLKGPLEEWSGGFHDVLGMPTKAKKNCFPHNGSLLRHYPKPKEGCQRAASQKKPAGSGRVSWCRNPNDEAWPAAMYMINMQGAPRQWRRLHTGDKVWSTAGANRVLLREHG
ncbi:hypothetical protein MAPG_11474 [Magnaporthiopsis poae ATCC 64411]|uniref:Uncharacterized protein n=1 Tax=Magnaporthiopsis poae (strain ATCC 64411 / 73-15) TaxID=644358 RepID=A0A0C4EFD1_MAGP6|nr:hypothetical protein MAPG_11474 [Magnaporthiopsis poae ATCC 64411]